MFTYIPLYEHIVHLDLGAVSDAAHTGHYP